MPTVSIITPCYNSSQHIVDCIDSVRSQTFDDWEHIVVDDGSSDDSAALVNEVSGQDRRTRLIIHGHNRGPGQSRNTGVAAATGRYIAFLDADDEWLPDKLRHQITLMQQHGWPFTCTDYAVIDDDGNMIRSSVGVPARIDYTTLLKNTAIGCLTVMIDRHRIQDLDMPDMPSGQDYALWYRILRGGTVAHGIDEVLARYRVVPGSVSRNKVRAAQRMWRLYREFEGLGRVRASWYFLNYAVNALRKHHF